MSKLNLYALHDATVGMYNKPFPQPNDQTAIRGFIQACTNPESEFYKNSNDYSLFRIGTYDEETSIIKSECPPEHLITASQAIANNNKLQIENSIKEKELYGSLLKTYEALAVEISDQTLILDKKLLELDKRNLEINKGLEL